MEPSGFDEANDVLGPPRGLKEGECSSLSIWRGPLNAAGLDRPVQAVVSCWRLEESELEEIKRTGRVWLAVFGYTMPPVIMMGVKPEFKSEGTQPLPAAT